jgi:hypothetical protein
MLTPFVRVYRCYFFWPTILLIVFAALDTKAYSASFDFDLDANFDGEKCNIRMTEEIAVGDLAQLQAKLGKDYQPGNAGPVLCLNSTRGGDFVEALNIANFVARGISTRLEKNAICVSACSWIFMSGTNWTTTGSWISRTADVTSTLTFHAPYIDPSTPNNQSGSKAGSAGILEAIRAYNQAVSEVGEGLLSLAKKYTTSDVQPLIPSSLLAQALAKTGTEQLTIDTVGKAIRWKIGVGGFGRIKPKSKEDVITVCRNASLYANEFWDLDNDRDAPEEYIAFFDAKNKVLTAQVVLSGMGGDACEVRIFYTDDLTEIDRIEADANLMWEDSLGLVWIKGMRDRRRVQLPNIALRKADTRLKDISETADVPINPSSLTNVNRPPWCKGVQRALDAKAICSNARLSAMDVIASRYFILVLAKSKQEQKADLRLDQRAWQTRRRICGDDSDCLGTVYRSVIATLREQVSAKQ